MDDDIHDTPEKAARGDIPERFTWVVWTEIRPSPGQREPSGLRLEPSRAGAAWVVGGVSRNASGDERPDEFVHWLVTGAFEDRAGTLPKGGG